MLACEREHLQAVLLYVADKQLLAYTTASPRAPLSSPIARTGSEAAASWRRGLPAYDFVLLEVIIIGLALADVFQHAAEHSSPLQYTALLEGNIIRGTR